MKGDIGCFLIVAGVAAGLWFAIWGRHTSLRYQLEYSTKSEMVTIARKPADCDFLSAPLGRKDCHYEKTVFVEKFDVDPSVNRPIVSRDGGKSWTWNDGGPLKGARVYVAWRKDTP